MRFSTARFLPERKADLRPLTSYRDDMAPELKCGVHKKQGRF